MKILVIPDIHLKTDIIDKAITEMERGKYDNAVFLGDFVDDWGKQSNIGLYDAIFDHLDRFLDIYPDSLICYGNHDISYVWKRLESGYSTLARDTVVARLNDLYKSHGKDRWKFIHKVDNVLFSHAGLTKGFILTHFAYDTDSSIEHIIETTNAMPDNKLWDDASPIWARPGDGYYFYDKGFLQVVGHTPVRKASLYFDNLLVCDTFSTYSNGTPIGNCKFVEVDTVTKEWREI